MENIVARQDEQLTARSQGTATSPAKWNKSATSVFLAGFSGSCLTGKKEKEKEAKEKAEKTTNTRRHKGTRECPTTKRSHKSAPEEKVQDTGNDGGTEAGPEEEHLEPTPTSPTKECQGKQGKRYPTNTPSGLPEKTLPPPRFPKERVVPQPSEEHIQVAGTEEPHKERRHNMGNRYNGWADHQRGNSQWGTGRREGRQWQEEDPNNWAWNGGQRDALLEHKPSIPHWYVLPKTHKPLDHVTGAWPGRPVLSGCSSPTRPVDRLLTTYLTPLLDLLPERLQDTTSFLQKMRDAKRYPGAILFSFDIVSLYPSIPQEEAAYVVANFYEQNFSYVEERLFSDFNMAAPPPYLIKEGIDHVLGGTLLRFNNRFFRQGKGTAIGASVSVAALRIKRIVSEEHKLETALQEMTGFFKARGYDNRCLNSALERVGNLQRDQLLIRKGHTLGNSLQDPPTNDSMEERKIDCREADQSAVPVASGRAQGVNEWQTTKLRYLKENRGGPRLPQSSKPAV
ncbi:hypothetical protein C7M84_019563 [Penaeus vannamei]|uniref:Reverse transcriptase domain-containing protein n=1 Tax=Penaeus vannamei TaxID=6689 RepID=A0A423SEE5_PENVA|nr:hypothetical protein C7M84_019563 [Penaeus vannamei]